jgi:hypothetical protein
MRYRYRRLDREEERRDQQVNRSEARAALLQQESMQEMHLLCLKMKESVIEEEKTGMLGNSSDLRKLPNRLNICETFWFRQMFNSSQTSIRLL